MKPYRMSNNKIRRRSRSRSRSRRTSRSRSNNKIRRRRRRSRRRLRSRSNNKRRRSRSRSRSNNKRRMSRRILRGGVEGNYEKMKHLTLCFPQELPTIKNLKNFLKEKTLEDLILLAPPEDIKKYKDHLIEKTCHQSKKDKVFHVYTTGTVHLISDLTVGLWGTIRDSFIEIIKKNLSKEWSIHFYHYDPCDFDDDEVETEAKMVDFCKHDMEADDMVTFSAFYSEPFSPQRIITEEQKHIIFDVAHIYSFTENEKRVRYTHLLGEGIKKSYGGANENSHFLHMGNGKFVDYGEEGVEDLVIPYDLNVIRVPYFHGETSKGYKNAIDPGLFEVDHVGNVITLIDGLIQHGKLKSHLQFFEPMGDLD